MSDHFTLLNEKVFKMQAEYNNTKHTIWEETLRLYLKPKPSWMPSNVWRRLVALVLVQEVKNK